MAKKLTVLLTALLLLTALPLTASHAAVEAKIEVMAVDGAVGDVVEIPLVITDCEGLDSLEFRINYDASALKFVRLDNGDVFESEFLISNPAEAGLVRVATISAYGLTQSGTLLTLKMKVLKDSGSVVTITDAIATSVDPENDFLQSKAYLTVTDGGVSVGGNALPASQTTPWIAETPEPTPSPEPTATPEPAATSESSPEPLAATPEPEPETEDAGPIPSSTAALLAAAGAALAVLIAAILLINRRQKR